MMINKNVPTISKAGRVARASVAAALALAVFSTGSFAQVRQVPQGHVLDSNPQVGGGGSNTPVPGYTPINGNDIISRNVTGLGYFHGPGLSSQNTFQGSLPSAAFQSFDSRSAGGVPMSSGGNVGQVYFQANTVVSTDSGRLYSAPNLGGQNNSIVPVISYSQAANPKISEALIGSSASVFDYAVAPVQTDYRPSTAGTVLNSNLFLQRQGNPLPEPTDINTTPNDNGAKPLVTPNPLDPNNANPQTDTGDPIVSANGTGRSKTVGTQASQRVNGNTGTQTANDQNNSNPDPLRPVRNDIGTQARVNDTYRNLLTELQKARADAQAKTAAAGTTIEPPPGGANPHPTATRVPHNTLLDEPTDVLRSGHEVKPLKTLADVVPNGTPTPFNQEMKQAEDLMKDGKFLDAVDVYQLALVMQPQNALAIIGRSHAELAAGMYQSAAFDLKAAFAIKPELISVRYDLNAVVPPKRLDNLFNDLLTLSAQEKTGNTASFLYCYLAYNTDHMNELQDELTRWGIRPGHDEWQAVGLKAWGK